MAAQRPPSLKINDPIDLGPSRRSSSASTETHDQYGFRKATYYIPLSQYESWTKPYSTFLRERKMNWTKLLEDSGLPLVMPITFPPKSSKIFERASLLNTEALPGSIMLEALITFIVTLAIMNGWLNRLWNRQPMMTKSTSSVISIERFQIIFILNLRCKPTLRTAVAIRNTVSLPLRHKLSGLFVGFCMLALCTTRGSAIHSH